MSRELAVRCQGAAILSPDGGPIYLETRPHWNQYSRFRIYLGNKEADMPAIIIPVLWAGGAAILLGGGWYVIGRMVH